MNKIRAVVMYIVWTLAIITLLATTFTNFQYLDLNAIALGLLFFALLNSLLMSKS